MSITLDGSNGITTPMYNGATASNQVTPSVNMKNRIINGAMVIDQRNAGVLQTSIGNNAFIADRISYQRAGLGITAVFNSQQSTTAPTGWSNSAYLTATTGQTLTTSGGRYMMYRYAIEGYNIADALKNQSNVTLSFWVNFSNNGTYSVVFTNAVDRSYGTTYTVTSANTWQQITLTIPLNASGGTWNYTNGDGLEIRFVLDCDNDTCTSSNNAWVSSNSYGAYNQNHGSVTTGATFYITGVQLEVGSSATSFDYRPYGTELALCQRYYTRFTSGGSYTCFGTGVIDSSTNLVSPPIKFPVSMRAQPTINYSTVRVYDGSSAPAVTGLGTNYSSVDFIAINFTASGGGLTTGRAGVLTANNSTSAYIDASAEL